MEHRSQSPYLQERRRLASQPRRQPQGNSDASEYPGQVRKEPSDSIKSQGMTDVQSGPIVGKSELQARIISGSMVLLSGSSLAIAINLAYNVAVAHFLGPKG